MSRKVYMHYDETENASLHVTLKMTLPAKWSDKTVDYLRDFFVEQYNQKKPENTLSPIEFHLEKKGNTEMYGSELIQTVINSYDDIFLRPGASKTKCDTSSRSEISTKVDHQLTQCRNYGCQKKYDEKENHDQACRHHLQPPTFHDLKKGWQCCSSKMVYDWDDFEKIAPCSVGRHTSQPPSVEFMKSQTTPLASPETTPAASAPAVKSIDDFNKKNPNAVTAVSSFETESKKAPIRTDGKARCVNYGCQKEFTVNENAENACQHHAAAPVFHDAGKYWSCCPNLKKYDFDEFLSIPGCVSGPHKQ